MGNSREGSIIIYIGYILRILYTYIFITRCEIFLFENCLQNNENIAMVLVCCFSARLHSQIL